MGGAAKLTRKMSGKCSFENRAKTAATALIALLLLSTVAALFPSIIPVAMASPAATITLNPSKGTVGTPVTINGEGFTPGKIVTVYFDANGNGIYEPGEVWGTTGVDARGTFTMSETVPSVTAGYRDYRVYASDGVVSATAYFTVARPTIVISPDKGTAGTEITVDINYFTLGHDVQVFLDVNNNNLPDDNDVIIQVKYSDLNDTGGATVEITVPEWIGYGAYNIIAKNDLGDVASKTFTVMKPVVVIVDPATKKGVAGMTITVQVNYFNRTAGAGTTFVFFDVNKNNRYDPDELKIVLSLNNTGGVEATLTVPTVPYDTYPVNATNNIHSAVDYFTVERPVIVISKYPVGVPGTPVEVDINYFSLGKDVKIGYDVNKNGILDDDEVIKAVPAKDLNGTGGKSGIPVTAPAKLGYGPYTINATNDVQWAATTFTVMEPIIIISPDKGTAGTSITVEINYYNRTVATYVFFDTNGNGKHDVGERRIDWTVNKLNATGGASTTLIVPDSVGYGPYTVYANNSLGQVKSATFTVMEPVITISPTSGSRGTIVTVTINYFNKTARAGDTYVFFDTNGNGKYDDGEPRSPTTGGLKLNNTGGATATIQVPWTIDAGVYKIYAVNKYQSKYSEFTVLTPEQAIEKKLDEIVIPKLDEIIGLLKDDTFGLRAIRTAIDTLASRIEEIAGTIMSKLTTIEGLLYEIKASVSTINWADITAINAKLGTFSGSDTVASLLYDIRGRLEAITPGAQAASGSGATQFTSSQSVVIYSGEKVGTVTVSIKTSGVTYGERLVIRYYLDNTNYIEKVVTSSRDTTGWTDTAAAMKVELVYTWRSGTDTVYYAYSVIYPP